MNFIYMQGKLLKPEDFPTDISARFFKFGDAVFERLRVENAKIFNLQFHINRLKTGLLDLKINFDITEFEKICRLAIMQTDLQNGYLRVQICRSGTSKGYLPLENKSFVAVEISEGLISASNAKLHIYSKPAQIISQAKTANALNYVLASMEAAENNCDNAILLSPEGYICECTNANIFWVRNNQIYTPSLDLPLITGSVQNIIMQNFEVKQIKAKISELINVDEIFVTNTSVVLQNVIDIKGVTPNLTSSNLSGKIKKSVLNNSNFG